MALAYPQVEYKWLTNRALYRNLCSPKGYLTTLFNSNDRERSAAGVDEQSGYWEQMVGDIDRTHEWDIWNATFESLPFPSEKDFIEAKDGQFEDKPISNIAHTVHYAHRSPLHTIPDHQRQDNQSLCGKIPAYKDQKYSIYHSETEIMQLVDVTLLNTDAVRR